MCFGALMVAVNVQGRARTCKDVQGVRRGRASKDGRFGGKECELRERQDECFDGDTCD